MTLERMTQTPVPEFPWIERETPCVQCWHDCRFHGDRQRNYVCSVADCLCIGFSVQIVDVLTDGNAL